MTQLPWHLEPTGAHKARNDLSRGDLRVLDPTIPPSRVSLAGLVGLSDPSDDRGAGDQEVPRPGRWGPVRQTWCPRVRWATGTSSRSSGARKSRCSSANDPCFRSWFPSRRSHPLCDGVPDALLRSRLASGSARQPSAADSWRWRITCSRRRRVAVFSASSMTSRIRLITTAGAATGWISSISPAGWPRRPPDRCPRVPVGRIESLRVRFIPPELGPGVPGALVEDQQDCSRWRRERHAVVEARRTSASSRRLDRGSTEGCAR